MNQLIRESVGMRRISVLKRQCWRDGDGLCEGLARLLGAIRNRGLSPILLFRKFRSARRQAPTVGEGATVRKPNRTRPDITRLCERVIGLLSAIESRGLSPVALAALMALCLASYVPSAIGADTERIKGHLNKNGKASVAQKFTAGSPEHIVETLMHFESVLVHRETEDQNPYQLFLPRRFGRLIDPFTYCGIAVRAYIDSYRVIRGDNAVRVDTKNPDPDPLHYFVTVEAVVRGVIVGDSRFWKETERGLECGWLGLEVFDSASGKSELFRSNVDGRAEIVATLNAIARELEVNPSLSLDPRLRYFVINPEKRRWRFAISLERVNSRSPWILSMPILPVHAGLKEFKRMWEGRARDTELALEICAGRKSKPKTWTPLDDRDRCTGGAGNRREEADRRSLEFIRQMENE